MPNTASRTINLTRISEDNYHKEVLRKKFDYDSELDERAAFKREFLEQKTQVKKLYDEKSSYHVAPLIEGVQKFLIKSSKNNTSHILGLHSETLLLDMKVSDHEMIFSKIEKTVKKHSNNFLVVRFKHNIGRKKIPDFLEPVRQAKRVFIIVEQTESIDRSAIKTLAGYLQGRLSDPLSPTSAILVLFCFSTSSQYPIDLTESFGLMRGIYKSTSQSKHANLRLLLESRDLKVKLDPRCLNFIYEQTINGDPSITSVEFLHIFSLFEHYRTTSSLLSESEFRELEERHQSMCDDLFCLAEFLKEKDSWPGDASYIYDELVDHRDLGESQQFYDALQVIKTTPKERSHDRFNRVAALLEKSGDTLNEGVAPLILSYEHLIKDKDYITKLMKDLMDYAKKMSCSFEKHEYFSNYHELEKQCFTGRRSRIPESFRNNETYFGVMFNKVVQSEGIESVSELFYEVLDDFKRLIKLHRAGANDIDGLARAIFVDMIESMEHQDIIKMDYRSKNKIFRRLAWPLVD